MSPYRVSVHITPRSGILDPQGKAVEGALHSLGFESVKSVRVGRHIIVDSDGGGDIATSISGNVLLADWSPSGTMLAYALFGEDSRVGGDLPQQTHPPRPAGVFARTGVVRVEHGALDDRHVRLVRRRAARRVG